MFSNGDVYDGFFQKGMFQGLGVYFKAEDGKWLYGMFKANNCVQTIKTGDGYPLALICNSHFHPTERSSR